MTEIPTDAELREVLRGLKKLGAISDLTAATGLSEGTLYRHARPEGAKGQPKELDNTTRRTLLTLFSDLGVDADSGLSKLIEAVEAVRVLAATRGEAGDADAGSPPIEDTDDKRGRGTGGAPNGG